MATDQHAVVIGEGGARFARRFSPNGDGTYDESVAVADRALNALGYYRYVMPDNNPHTVVDMVGGTAAFNTLVAAGARGVVLYFETNGVRLICRGDLTAPTVTTVGTPRATGIDFDYTIQQLANLSFINATAGQAAIVHCEVFG